jgi:hypothetical protein
LLGSLGFAAAAEVSGGGLTLAHVVELVLIVAITTNFVQFTWSRCAARPKGFIGHFSRFAPFYAALVSTPLLCFPKADVVVGDLITDPAVQNFTNLNWPGQISALSGAILMAAAAVLLSRAPLEDKKANPLLPTTS